jgi:hypothetical protein
MVRKVKSGTRRSSDQPKTRNTEVSSSPAGEEDYKVGPGRPPKEHQWKKGQSGNPKGRKRKKPSLLPELKEIVVTSLSKKVRMTDGEHERHLTRFETMIEQLTVQAAKGDKYARRDLLLLVEKLGLDLPETSAPTDQTLPADREAILDAYVERRTQETNTFASSPVLAPPELLDDDAPDNPKER